MFSHVMVGTNDIEESRIFYDKIFEVLGAGPGKMYPNLTGQKRYFYNLHGTSFCISEPIDGNPATVSNGATIGFNIESIENKEILISNRYDFKNLKEFRCVKIIGWF